MQIKDKILQDFPWLQNVLKEAKAESPATLTCKVGPWQTASSDS